MMWLSGLALLCIAWLGAGLHEGLGGAIQKRMPLVLAFGGSFLIGLIFTHLAPEAYAFGPAVGMWVLVGFMIQIGLEYLSQGIEHGHVHHPAERSRIPWGVFFSLCLHAFLESMPLAEGGHDHGHHHHHHADMASLDWPLLLGLALHKLPVALVLMSLLSGLRTSHLAQWALITFFGLMPIAGMLAYEALVHSGGWSGDAAIPMAAHGLLIGILLHISTTILFETADGHRFNAVKLGVTLVGLLLSVLISQI